MSQATPSEHAESRFQEAFDAVYQPVNRNDKIHEAIEEGARWAWDARVRPGEITLTKDQAGKLFRIRDVLYLGSYDRLCDKNAYRDLDDLIGELFPEGQLSSE